MRANEESSLHITLFSAKNNPLDPNISMHILHTTPCVDKAENWSNNQELLKLMAISFHQVTSVYDSGLTFYGEIRC